MHKITFVALTTLLFTFPAVAHEDAHDGGAGAPFALVKHTLQKLSAQALAKAETGQTPGILSDDKKSLSYSAATIRLVVRTGPEDDMLSYRIQGVRNPTLVVPKGAVLRVLFVNTDEDMPHDIHFGAIKPPFPIAPGMEGAVGSAKLPPLAKGKYAADELSIQAASVGSFTYYCSVRGHAKGGMFGTIAVGATPEESSTRSSASTSTHDHSTHEAETHEHSTTNDAAAHNDSAHKDLTPRDAAAHEHSAHEHSMSNAAAANPDEKSGAAMSDQHSGHDKGLMSPMSMRSTVDLNDPMSRESSGTAWLPDSSPMYAKMRMKGDKMLMFHGQAFPRYTSVGGDRDVSVAGKGSRSRLDAPTMFMGMYSQPSGKRAQLGFRLMTSLDPIIEKSYGYPLLYQSGEVSGGQPIHDRQHPHDLISELSATYSWRLGANRSAYFYVGYPGEPALGPPTFMHRISAMDNPDAPISHHWQDSTHVTFGVLTAGYSFGRFKVESSVFKGREPDENRYNFDSPKLDSYSGRLSWNPTRDLALQVSHGFLQSPEATEPDENQHRTTASIIWNKPLGEDSNWANTFSFGQIRSGGHKPTNSFLFETDYQRRRNTFYARFERVQKSGHELVLPTDNVFNVGSYAVGYVRDLKRNKGLDVGLGAQVTFNTNPSGLAPYYGGRTHTGFQVFLRIRPSRLRMDDMDHSTKDNGMKMNMSSSSTATAMPEMEMK